MAITFGSVAAFLIPLVGSHVISFGTDAIFSGIKRAWQAREEAAAKAKTDRFLREMSRVVDPAKQAEFEKLLEEHT